MRASGHALDASGEHWIVNCPACNKEHEYKGVFDAGEKTKCTCGKTFTTTRVWINDDEYLI